MKYICGLMIFCAISAFASEPQKSKIEKLVTYYNSDFVFVKLVTPPINKPACATNVYDYTFHVGSAQGNAIYSSLVAAYHSGAELTYKGWGVCDAKQNNAEVLHYILAE